MSLPPLSLGDWFSVSRWDRGRWVGIYTKGENSMDVSGFVCKNPSAG